MNDAAKRSRRGLFLFVVLWAATLVTYLSLFVATLRLDSPILSMKFGFQPTEKGMMVGPLDPRTPFAALGVVKGDVVARVEDARGRIYLFRTWLDVNEAIDRIRFGEPWALWVIPGRDDGQTEVRVAVPAASRPSYYRLFFSREMGIGLFLFLLNFTAATVIGFWKHGGAISRAAACLFLCLCRTGWGENIYILLPRWYLETGTFVWVLLFSMLSVFFLRFFLSFPSDSPLKKRFPWLGTAGLVFGWSFTAWNMVLSMVFVYAPTRYKAYYEAVAVADYVFDTLFVAMFLLGMVSLVLNIRRTPSPGERRKLLALLACCLLGMLPWQIVYLAQIFEWVLLPKWFAILSILLRALFPIFFVWAVVKNRLFGIRVMVRRGLRFALLSKGALFLEGLAIFAGLYYAIEPFFDAMVGTDRHGVLAVAAAGASMAALAAIGRVNRSFMGVLERKYFRETHDARKTMADFSVEMRRHGMEPDRLFSALLRTVAQVMHPERAVVCFRVHDLLRFPADNEGMKHLRRTAAAVAEDSFLTVGEVVHGRDGRIALHCPMDTPLVLGKESRALRFIIRKSTGSGGQLVIPPRNRSWAGAEGGDKADRFLIDEAAVRLVVPLPMGESVAGFLCLGEKLSEEPFSSEDAEFLQALSQQAASTLDYAALMLQSREQAHLLREMEIARQVQTNLFPTVQVPTEGLVYTGLCRPARYVGGDYFDFQRVGEDKLALALGDIMGKGVSAALVMAGLQAALRMQLSIRGDQPGEAMAEVNRHLCGLGEDRRFATLFLCLFDPETRSLTYVGAGHNPPLLFRADSPGAPPEELASSGLLLGVSPAVEYEAATVGLAEGDLLVIYSDGITEAMNESMELYGDERFAAFLADRRHLEPQALAEEILHEIKRFTGNAPQSDDITLLIARGV